MHALLLMVSLAVPRPSPALIHGHIAAVNRDELLVRQEDGSAFALRLQPGYTHLHVNGLSVSVNALQPGEPVTATWVSGHGEPVARDVNADGARPKF